MLSSTPPSEPEILSQDNDDKEELHPADRIKMNLNVDVPKLNLGSGHKSKRVTMKLDSN